LVTTGLAPVQAAATSSLAIAIAALSGSIQNWRDRHLDPQKVLYLGIPAGLAAQLGAYWADIVPPHLLLVGFGLFLLLNIYLIRLHNDLAQPARPHPNAPAELAVAFSLKRAAARIGTGIAAGLLAGLFGVGGGAILVPL
jgi:hypothetical protein